MWSDLLYLLGHPGEIPPLGWAILISAGFVAVTYLALLGRVRADNAENAGGRD